MISINLLTVATESLTKLSPRGKFWVFITFLLYLSWFLSRGLKAPPPSDRSGSKQQNEQKVLPLTES